MFELVKLFEEDPDDRKLNLILGVCIDDNKKVQKFNVVQTVSRRLLNDDDYSHSYTTLSGLPGLAPLATKLIFGPENPDSPERKILAFQSCGATGALALGARLLTENLKRNKIYIPIQTWEQHIPIFEAAGFEIFRYRYYNSDKQQVDFDGLIEDLQNAEEHSVVILHGSCHNPTGGVLSLDQWAQIMSLLRERGLFPFFDIAYQGLGKDLESDSMSVKMFSEAGMEFFTSQTFSKNFGLYGDRVGFIFIQMNDSSDLTKLHSALEYLGSNTYLMPPSFGAKIVYEILRDDDLRNEWMGQLSEYNNRMTGIKAALKESLERKVANTNFNFLEDNEGLFGWFNFTGNEAQVLREQYHIYVLANGRVNLSGLSLSDVEYFTDSMAKVL